VWRETHLQQGFLDGIDIAREEFYQKLPTFPVHPTTAVPSPNRFQVLYKALAEAGASHILSIHVSASLSSVVDVARLAARETASVMNIAKVDGLASVGLFAALFKVNPRQPTCVHGLALIGCAAFCLQTALWDAVLWSAYSRV